jgi:hypothetical protein
MDGNPREVPHLVLRQVERDRVGRDTTYGSDRNRYIAPAEEVTAFEDDVRDCVVAVDDEAVDMAEPVAVSGDDRLCA